MPDKNNIFPAFKIRSTKLHDYTEADSKKRPVSLYKLTGLASLFPMISIS